MKPTSALSLVLFLHLASSAPIPARYHASLSTGCPNYPSCHTALREVLSSTERDINKPNNRLPSPHFPAHQISSDSPQSHREHELDESFNNSPMSPPSDMKPSAALSSIRPLESSYLLSLTNPALDNPPQGEPQGTSTSSALPSKPTSALPRLRKEDALRYWATVSTSSSRPIGIFKSSKGVDEPVRDGQWLNVPKCGDSNLAESAYVRAGQPMLIAREYSDLLVVGIVVLFLVAVVVLEALQYFRDSRAATCGWRTRRRSASHGEIFLGDGEKAGLVVKEPLYLQPAPLSRDELGSTESVKVDSELD